MRGMLAMHKHACILSKAKAFHLYGFQISLSFYATFDLSAIKDKMSGLLHRFQEADIFIYLEQILPVGLSIPSEDRPTLYMYCS